MIRKLGLCIVILYIHLELARLAAGTTVDKLNVTIDDFRLFERISHPWREQSNTGNDKHQRVLMHVRRSIDNVRCWPLQHRHSYFLWWFHGKISMILNDFCIHGVRKATPVRQKRTRFHVILQVGRRRAFLSIARPESIFFHAHFAVICDAFWRHFAWFWAPVWKPDLGIWMLLEATQNA